MTIASTIWGLRLSLYLLARILKIGKDDRFDDKNRGFSLEFAGRFCYWSISVTVYVCTIVLEFERMNRFGKKSDNTLMKLFSYVHYLHYFIDFE